MYINILNIHIGLSVCSPNNMESKSLCVNKLSIYYIININTQLISLFPYFSTYIHIYSSILQYIWYPFIIILIMIFLSHIIIKVHISLMFMGLNYYILETDLMNQLDATEMWFLRRMLRIS